MTMLSKTEWTVIASRPANKPEVRWQWVDGYEPGATLRAADRDEIIVMQRRRDGRQEVVARLPCRAWKRIQMRNAIIAEGRAA